jgi:hypothetical protein
MEEYAEGYDLDISGTKLKLRVQAQGSSPTAEDQVPL